MGWDRHELLWNGMGQKNMSHGQACGLDTLLIVYDTRKDVQVRSTSMLPAGYILRTEQL